MPSYTPGDILLVRDYTGGSDLIGNLILAGQRARYGNTDFARWTHCALIVSEGGDLLQAMAGGIEGGNVSDYRDRETLIISPPQATSATRALTVAGAQSQVGRKYNYFDFASLAVDLLFKTNLSFGQQGRYICSQFCSRYTEKAIPSYQFDPADMMPADIGRYYDALSGQPLPKLSFFGRVLDKFRALVWAAVPWRSGLAPAKGAEKQL